MFQRFREENLKLKFFALAWHSFLRPEVNRSGQKVESEQDRRLGMKLKNLQALATNMKY